MPLQMKKRCPSCHASVSNTTNYCPSCGHHLTTSRGASLRCPTCHRQLDAHSTYCNYCGTTLKHSHSSRRVVHFFFSLIIFLLLVLLLFLFFGIPSGVFESPQPSTDTYVPIQTVPDVDLPASPPPQPLVPQPPSARRTYEYTKSFWVRAIQNVKTAEGYGITTLAFPDPVNHCFADGTWEIDNDFRARLTGYCDRATGSFDGYADAYRQYVTNDPDYFRWDAKISQDPPPQTYDSSFLYMHTCSTDYYRDNKNVVYATISGFGTKNLQIEWFYKDNTEKPAVDFIGTLTCELERA